jgi:hypothetical protein
MMDELGFTPLLTIITPATTQGEMNTISNLATQLGREIGASTIAPDFKTGYAAFYSEWQNYLDTHSDWLTRGLSATYEKVLEYKQRLNDWQNRFKTAGYNTSVERAGSAGFATFPWRSIGISLGVAAGLYFVLHSFLRSTRG